jgi:hypothetical protein
MHIDIVRPPWARTIEILMAYKARLQLDSDLSSTTLPGKKNKGVFSFYLKIFHPITLNV